MGKNVQNVHKLLKFMLKTDLIEEIICGIYQNYTKKCNFNYGKPHILMRETAYFDEGNRKICRNTD